MGSLRYKFYYYIMGRPPDFEKHVRAELRIDRLKFHSRGQSRLRKIPSAVNLPGHFEICVNSGAVYIGRPKLRENKGPICVGRLRN
jgi:hypothetical protein